jgi:hypothetical protein
MLKFVKFAGPIFILVLLPLFLSWWMFIPLALVAIMIGRNIYGTLIAAFILDLVYIGKLPYILFGTVLFVVLFFILRDKIRNFS